MENEGGREEKKEGRQRGGGVGKGERKEEREGGRGGRGKG